MQSRGFFAARRSADESTRGNATTRLSNGDVIRTDYRLSDHLSERTESREGNRYRYDRPERNRRDRSVAHPKNAYPSTSNGNQPDLELTPRRPVRPRDYSNPYEDGTIWKDFNDLNTPKPILRQGVGHARGERLYSSTLPRRSRTINFRDQPCNSLEYRRSCPKSLQDLSDLELDDGVRGPSMSLPSNHRDWRNDRSLDDGSRRRRHREDQLEDNYLRLYRNLSRLSKYPQGGKYEPGQVHYERECRTFGKDTVAFIYYKTCYL